MPAKDHPKAKLYELLYSSIACRQFTHAELILLSNAAEKNNRETELSGCLVYFNREFLQVLEGDRETVLAMFDDIIHDERHSNIKIIWQGEIEERAFESWGMAFVNLENHNREKDTTMYDLIGEGMSSGKFTGHETTAHELMAIIRRNML